MQRAGRPAQPDQKVSRDDSEASGGRHRVVNDIFPVGRATRPAESIFQVSVIQSA